MKKLDEGEGEVSRRRQVLVGLGMILGVALVVVTLLMMWRRVPGFGGETLGMFVGILTTPFLMEGSFLVLGFFLLLVLNTHRRRREGDEFVEYEEDEI